MAQVLWNSQDQTLPGHFPYADRDVPVNWRFSYIRHRVRLGAAANMEVGVYAADGAELWLGESKCWRDLMSSLGEQMDNALNCFCWFAIDIIHEEEQIF